MKKLQFLFIGLFAIAISACSNDDNGDPQSQTGGDHSYTFTITGQGVNGETFTATVPNQEIYNFYTPIPNTSYTGAYFSLSNGSETIAGNFLKDNNNIRPLGQNQGNTIEDSQLNIVFTHQGQVYTLESLSGTCISERFEVGPEGSTASFKISFTGIFTGGPAGTNDPTEFEVTGMVDTKFYED